MNKDPIGALISPGKQIAVPADLWDVTKLEYFDERPPCNPAKVIHVEFAGTGDGQVLVRRLSLNAQLQRHSTAVPIAIPSGKAYYG